MTSQQIPNYQWVIVLGGIAGLFASLGLGRFSLGMMLPAMGQGLELSYSQMGLISTLNFTGYLLAVLFCGPLTAWFGHRMLISVALTLAGVSMVLIGFTDHYLPILLLYFLTGVGSALSNVPIMALIGVWFDSNTRGRAMGLCVMGNGLGILVSGKAVPLLNTVDQGWRMSWLVLGSVVVCIALLCFMLLRNSPAKDQKGSEGSLEVKDSADLSQTECSDGKDEGGGRLRQRQGMSGKQILYHCGSIYFLFGCSYVIYVTFFVTSLVQDRGLTEHVAGNLWAWVGLISLVSGPLFGHLSDLYGRKLILAAVFFIQASAYLLAGVDLPLFFVYCSLSCFGLVVWSVPTIMAALVGDHAGPERTASYFGLVTFLFGIGQIVGPALAGFLAERMGNFSMSFLLAAALAIVAVVLSLFLPRRTVVP